MLKPITKISQILLTQTVKLNKPSAILLVIPQDDHITVVFFPGFQLDIGKKGIFLYDLVRAGSQPALGGTTGNRL